jgi:ferredoxin-NADP reductase
MGIDVGGVGVGRAYTLPPGPGADGRISITVKAVPDGKVSHHLVRRAKPGTLIQLDQPTGDFVLPQAKPAKVLYLTAGSGITPVMGMLRDTEFDDVVMVHFAPRPQYVNFRNELHYLVAGKKLRLTEVHTDTDGMLDITRLGELVPDWAERETWACGPAGLLDAAEEHWTEYGVQERLHTERFRPGIVVAGDGGEVTFSATGKTVDADGATPLLDVGEEAGVLMPSGCRMGICFGCVSPLMAGAVRDLRTGEITEAEPGVLIQTCVSAAAGPCDIER